MKKLFISLLLCFSSILVNAEFQTLGAGRGLFAGKHICEILPVNEKVVKVVLFNDRIKTLDTYYFTKGQTLYSSYSEILREHEITFNDYYGKPEYSSKVTIISFDYNVITIKVEPVISEDDN